MYFLHAWISTCMISIICIHSNGLISRLGKIKKKRKNQTWMKRNMTGSSRSACCTHPAHYLYQRHYSHIPLSYFSHSHDEDNLMVSHDKDNLMMIMALYRKPERGKEEEEGYWYLKKLVGFLRPSAYKIGKVVAYGTSQAIFFTNLLTLAFWLKKIKTD